MDGKNRVKEVREVDSMSFGNEATSVGMALPLRPGRDVVSLLHRDFAAHEIFQSLRRLHDEWRHGNLLWKEPTCEGNRQTLNAMPILPEVFPIS